MSPGFNAKTIPCGERACSPHVFRWLAALLLLGLSSLAQAFDLQQLSDQLARPDVIHGNFIQEKHLRALPQPLTSKGTFVLAKNNGLLWLLKTPLQQDYRITAKGIARRDASGWQMLPGKSAGAEQNRLFLAVLQGDSSGLQRDFELALSGDAQHWKLTLTPRSLLLKQVFNQINITGSELVQTIELLETQGDSTVLRMQDSTSAQPLSDAEQHDFAE
ncbi:outer membrane lipoprotein carrier protein LolA [Rhodococcus sp. IEGM1300]